MLLYLLFLSSLILPNLMLGQCKGDCLNGFGSYESSNGHRYVGNWSKGKRSGYGIFYWASGKKYMGYWINSKREGEGNLFLKDGTIISGIWKANKFVRRLHNDHQINSKTLSQAKDQIDKMLKDRPAMAQIVPKGSYIYNWILHQMAGQTIGEVINWQNKANENFIILEGFDAVHVFPTEKHKAQIWLKESDNGEDLWSSFIYELHNIANYKAFQQIEEDVRLNRCTREEYIMRYAKLEHNACLATAKFYHDIWKPFFTKEKVCKKTKQMWFVYMPVDFKIWQNSFGGQESYPWHPYSTFYDKAVQRAIRNY